MTDNRTDELREKLNKLIIELDRLDITLDSPVSSMTLGEYEQEREKLLDEFIQAIAATLGSGECEVVNHGSPYDGGVPLLQCSSCDGLFYGNAKGDVPNYCPNCGRKVVDA